MIHDQEFELKVSTFYVTVPIGPLEATIRRSLDEDIGYVFHSLTGHQPAPLAELFKFQMEFQVHVPAATATGILDWSMSLEQAGILGKGMTFTVREREATKTMSSGNVYNIHGNTGVLGDVAHSTVNSTQSVHYTQADLTELRGIVDQIGGAAGQLPDEAQQSVVAALRDAWTELDATQPNHDRLKKAHTSIRTTSEGAVENLIGAGIVGLIAKFLS